MLPVLIGLGLLIGLPVLYIFSRWHALVSAERQAAKLLTVQARRIPRELDAMTVSEAVAAKNILTQASELPSLTPRDIPEVDRLWQARHLIHMKARQRSDDHTAPSVAAVLDTRMLASSFGVWSDSVRGREVATEARADERQAWGREARLQAKPQDESAADLHRVSSRASDKREKSGLQEAFRNNMPRHATAMG